MIVATGDEAASAIFGPQKGSMVAIIREFDVALKYYADIIKRDLDQDVDRVSDTGVAVGMSAGLQA
ncbi:glycerate kinase, partial [Sodalis-like endosymbiont of Proechinophthirus fluctus]|uniref:glycerate kinase n=1 Tax=Sodalis-like endosymbiont of Proechinophthirus fluctus TaxID=1462730 RepID=UPI0007A89AEE